jgi:ribosomal RNA-processing protein 8
MSSDDDVFTSLPQDIEKDEAKYESFLEEQAQKFRDKIAEKKREKQARRMARATAASAAEEGDAEPPAPASKKSKKKKKQAALDRRPAEPEPPVKSKKAKVVLPQSSESSGSDMDQGDESNSGSEDSDERSFPSAGKKDLKKKSASNGTDDLRRQMLGARFRLLNEQLYSIPSAEATTLFQEHPDLFAVYHDGFAEQVKSWPENPVDHYIDKVNHESLIRGELVVGDFGCGDGQLGKVFLKGGQTTATKVHSFDLVAKFPHITACDIAKVPIDDKSLDVAIFCLSLMGTNWADFIGEAWRTLKKGGELWITEVTSRIDNVKSFVASIKSMGFNFTGKDATNSHFVRFSFTKNPKAPTHPIHYQLGVCKYKKR